jgi:hypothetical protein
MSIKHTKMTITIPKFSIPRPPNICQKYDIWYENIPSGNLDLSLLETKNPSSGFELGGLAGQFCGASGPRASRPAAPTAARSELNVGPISNNLNTFSLL